MGFTRSLTASCCLLFLTWGVAHAHDVAPIGPPLRTGDVQGMIATDVVRRVIRAHYPEMRAFYQSLLLRVPAARGRVVVVFVIGTTGAITTAGVASSEIDDEAFLKQVTTAVRGFVFPAMPSGDVTVTYPLRFAPDR